MPRCLRSLYKLDIYVRKPTLLLVYRKPHRAQHTKETEAKNSGRRPCVDGIALSRNFVVDQGCPERRLDIIQRALVVRKIASSACMLGLNGKQFTISLYGLLGKHPRLGVEENVTPVGVMI